MIKEFVAAWERGKPDLRQRLAEIRGVYRWLDLVRDVVRVLAEHEDAGMWPYAERVTEVRIIDDCHGDAAFIVPGVVGQAWYVRMHYGSCSACDALQRALDMDPPERTDALMRLALHVVQRLRVMEGPE